MIPSLKTTLTQFAALLLFSTFALFAAPARAAPPNVLLIISDDLTATALSCYGNTACRTPNIDRLCMARTSREFCCAKTHWTFIQYAEDTSQGIELFDMLEDPNQYTNVAGNRSSRPWSAGSYQD